jgi:hypothetical protein
MPFVCHSWLLNKKSFGLFGTFGVLGSFFVRSMGTKFYRVVRITAGGKRDLLRRHVADVTAGNDVDGGGSWSGQRGGGNLRGVG